MCSVKGNFFRPWDSVEESSGSLSDNLSPNIKSEYEEENKSVSSRSDDSPENGSLDMLSNFVFNSSRDLNTYEGSMERTTERTTSSPCDSCPSIASPNSAFTPTYTPICTDYLSALGSNPIMSYDATVNLLQSQIYYPGHYPSVEEAVRLIHQQDIAAKQMKKLRPKKFRCEHCNVAFSNNGQLRGHIRIHTGERPFECDSCGKKFTRNEELTRHKRIHTGLRPHACVICGKRFGRKDHLKKHTRTHDNRGPFPLPHLGAFGHPTLLSPYFYSP
ncbi:zinc finger protein 629-like [Microplitis mediator]|uniref:zinc finger protein 629-like n=1 Tax=Microplitis mediator TaxID=375433 RepID=UPI002556D453|nr:zinc finger protein 629-like [Microplitis mediator]